MQVSCTIREGQEEMNVYDDGNFFCQVFKSYKLPCQNGKLVALTLGLVVLAEVKDKKLIEAESINSDDDHVKSINIAGLENKRYSMKEALDIFSNDFHAKDPMTVQLITQTKAELEEKMLELITQAMEEY